MSPRDTIDLGEVLAVLRRGIRWIAAGAVVGLMAAGAATLLLPPRYESRATVLLRSGDPASSTLMGGGGSSSSQGTLSLGGFADLFSRASGFDTELEILASRSVLTSVIDSLGLQLRVMRPRGLALGRLFSAVAVDADAPNVDYRFERSSTGFQVRGGGIDAVAVPGQPFRLSRAVVTLQTDGLPDAFTLRVMDLEVAFERLMRRLEAGRAGGEIAELLYRADDPEAAAAVPNAVADHYLRRRKTTDRGVNQRRYEFLLVHTDSIRSELSLAGQRLRQHQEVSGVVDPELYGKAEIERGAALRTERDAREIEIQALQRILAQASAGRLSARELGAYPTFLQNAAINGLLSRMTELESRRTELLDRRTENDPDVIVLEQTIAQVEAQLVSLARSYLQGLTQQQAQLHRELQRFDATLATLPAAAERSFQLHRDVERLAQTLTALETQLVQARLAAIGEGGDVRLVDVATPPRNPVFPKPWLNLVIGLFGGLMLGGAVALGRGYLGNRVDVGYQAELASGLPVTEFDGRSPLLLRNSDERHSVLLVPVGVGVAVGPVARHLAATASLQERSVVIADFDVRSLQSLANPEPPGETQSPSSAGAVANLTLPLRSEPAPQGGAYFVYRGADNGRAPVGPHRALRELEQHFALVVAVLPGLDSPSTTTVLSPERRALLVAQAGRTRRDELSKAVAALERVGVPVVGVVLRGRQNGDRGA